MEGFITLGKIGLFYLIPLTIGVWMAWSLFKFVLRGIVTIIKG